MGAPSAASHTMPHISCLSRVEGRLHGKARNITPTSHLPLIWKRVIAGTQTPKLQGCSSGEQASSEEARLNLEAVTSLALY